MIVDMSQERIVLDRLKVGASTRVGSYVAANLELETWRDDLLDSLVYRLRSEVLAKTLSTYTIDQRVEFEHPATTWQMFKRTHEHGRWLGWIARRWPVQYKTHVKWVTVENKHRAAFPDATVTFPKTLGNPVFFSTLEAR